MKKTLLVSLALISIACSLNAQKWLKQSYKEHRHGLVFSSDLVLAGSDIPYRQGLGLGYGYFGEKFNFKTMLEYGQISRRARNLTLGEFRFNMKIEYDHYVNNWFSIGAFMGPNFSYYEEWGGSNSPDNLSVVEYAMAFGASPKIYHQRKRTYFSFGVDLPLADFGYFQGTGPDPDAGDLDTFRQGLSGRVFSKEIRAVISFGYRL